MLPALLFANLFYVKLLDLIGSPESPGWLLGVALWPLALAWAAAGSFAQRRWAWPFWAAASLTSVVSAVLVQDRPHVSAGVMATFALVSVIAAWRLASPPVILLAVPWSLLAAWQLLTWFEFDVAARAVGIGLVGWPFLALSLVQRLGATRREPHGTSGPTRLVAMSSWADWSRAAAICAAVAGACGATLAYRDAEMWRIYTALAWIDLAALVAVVARLARSRDLLAGAALSLVPALLALISFVRPSDAQAYAIPTGGYLLAVAALIRRDHRQGRGVAASLVAASGVAALILTSVAQALDTERLGYVLWTLAEGVLLLGAGFALRWRVLVVGGVSGVVLIAVRLLFDAVSALPGWVILGGSGITLLGVAVALLLIRDRLTKTGRLVAERWASWD